jgi:predicted GNAT superfamily acetyltransferase
MPSRRSTSSPCTTTGILVGAFERERMVGFVCGFSGWDRGRVFHHSHMLAVVPERRGSGLGEKLKWAQRERVIGRESSYQLDLRPAPGGEREQT